MAGSMAQQCTQVVFLPPPQGVAFLPGGSRTFPSRRPVSPQDFCVIFPATLVEKESPFYHLFHHTPKLGLKGLDQVPCLSWASLRSLGLWRSGWPGPFRCLPGAGVESALQNSVMGSLGWWGSLGNTKVLFSEKRWVHAGQAKTRQGKMQ